MGTQAEFSPQQKIHTQVGPSPDHPRTTNQRRTEKASYVRLKHGMYSKRAIIPGESQEEFLSFQHDMILYWLPGNPDENMMVEQMVMTQWLIKRSLAGQTGVYEQLFDGMFGNPDQQEEKPFEYTQFVADCVHSDAKEGRNIDRLVLQWQRLVNIYAKMRRQYELAGEMRQKRLLRGREWDSIETEEHYLGRQGWLKRTVARPKVDQDGVPAEFDDPHPELTEMGEWEDEGATTPASTPPASIAGSSRKRSSLATSPASNGGSSEGQAAPGVEMSVSNSTDSASPEIADRREEPQEEAEDVLMIALHPEKFPPLPGAGFHPVDAAGDANVELAPSASSDGASAEITDRGPTTAPATVLPFTPPTPPAPPQPPKPAYVLDGFDLALARANARRDAADKARREAAAAAEEAKQAQEARRKMAAD